MKYYIYAYIRKSNNTPYYIGKGCKNRAYEQQNHIISVPKDKSKIVIERMKDKPSWNKGKIVGPKAALKAWVTKSQSLNLPDRSDN